MRLERLLCSQMLLQIADHSEGTFARGGARGEAREEGSGKRESWGRIGDEGGGVWAWQGEMVENGDARACDATL